MRGYVCKYCGGKRIPGYPEIVERYFIERVVHFISQYECGTTMDFILDGNIFKNFVWNRNCKDPIVEKKPRFRVED